ncbi:ChaN family lipoprotein [Geitlerinema sp. PCC 9228]|uniref:ChaN family lipoprotein n=1 Tax=Geitlerinema sp. PCC 9228 TaxID=111611 RepID=UPI00147E6530|nr:ChaN family lipoprotein [Geitlerinema sp. PCC 9228]
MSHRNWQTSGTVCLFSVVLLVAMAGELSDSVGMASRETTAIEQVSSLPQPEKSTFSPRQREILQELAKADVVYLGEIHTKAADHQAQLAIVQALQQRNRKVAIAMEMFQLPYQDVLDQYIRGEIDEDQLLEKTEYQQRWGYDWDDYAPILRYARKHQLPAIALNVPTETIRRVATGGWSGLTSEDQRWLPPRSEIHTDHPQYRQRLREIFDGIHAEYNSSGNFEFFYLAQLLWDETMAANIAKYATQHPEYQVVVLAGSGHIANRYGIPNRVARRMQNPDFTHKSVLLSPPPRDTDASNANSDIADYIWQPTSPPNSRKQS